MKGIKYFTFFLPFFLFVITESPGQLLKRGDTESSLSVVSHSNGNAVADYDNDGFLDIFIVSRKSFLVDDASSWNRLLHNQGDGTFEDVTLEAGFTNQYVKEGELGAMGQKMGASWGDYNSDGFADLLLSNNGSNQLYKNNGDGTFEDVTEFSGIKPCSECYTSSSLWWDYDNDGDIDLYLSDWVKPNTLYKNNGDGTFEDVTQETRMAETGSTWTSVPFDFNDDGWLDLYIVNDYSYNRLYLNNKGENFFEVAGNMGLDDNGDGMGVTIGDYNNDGRFDIYITNIFVRKPNALLTNIGNGTFRNDSKIYGVDDTAWGWGTHFFDCDHDGDLDIYAVNGADQLSGTNVFFLNTAENGALGFEDVSEVSETNGEEQARSMEVFDHDNDGDLDIIVSNWDASPYFFENQTMNGDLPNRINWIKINLEGTISNRNAIGTRIEITINGRTFHQYYHGAALLSQSIKPVHFGLGSARIIDQITIKWPSGLEETARNIVVNQTISVKENEDPIFNEVITGLNDDDLMNIELEAFPNPFIDDINLRLSVPYADNYVVRVFSSQGKQVYQSSLPLNSGINKVSLSHEDIGNLKSGLYLLRIESQEASFDSKIIKN